VRQFGVLRGERRASPAAGPGQLGKLGEDLEQSGARNLPQRCHDLAVGQYKLKFSPKEARGMIWTSSLETGISKIDEQHKELFRQIDILMDRGNDGRINDTIKFLGEYVVRHFNDEQAMHLASKYPKAAEHKKMHADFIAAYTRMKQEYTQAAGPEKLPVILKINKTVMDWLKNHILVHDKEFATYYKAQGK
jgi:hemerythrin